jgi:hypothetical protein
MSLPMRLTRIAGLIFGGLAVAAFAASILVDEAYPDQGEGLGLLFVVIAFLAGPIALVCGLIVGLRVYRIHRSRIGGPILVVVGAVLLLWLGRTLLHG